MAQRLCYRRPDRQHKQFAPPAEERGDCKFLHTAAPPIVASLIRKRCELRPRLMFVLVPVSPS
jgi:hypothetical protein